MSDYHAFLRHLLESPEDVVARLVFADWLEERDQALRAEFIRVSVQWANTTDETERKALAAHRDRLQTDHWDAISGGLPLGRRNRYRFDFGLPTRVVLTGAEAVSQGDAIFAVYPIPQICLLGSYHPAREIAMRNWLKHIQEIRFPRDPQPHAHGIAWLLGSPYLTNLRRLDLKSMGETGVICEAMAAQSRMYKLRSIDLSSSGVHVFALKSLCESPSLANVEELNLSNNPLTDSAGLTLTRCRYFKKLKVLNLSRPDHLSKPMRKRLRRHFGETLIL